MATATQVKAKQMSQQKLSQPKSKDSMQNFVDNRSNQAYQQIKADYWDQYNRQRSDSVQTAKDSYSAQWNMNERGREFQQADRNFEANESQKNRDFQMGLARQSQFGDARTSALMSVSKTDFNPEATMQMRMFRAQQGADEANKAQDYNNQVDMFNRQNAAKSQADASARLYQSGEAAKDRALAMQQSMWQSLSGAGQYNYRYW